MHFLMTNLLHFNIRAEDGEIGVIKDIYIDEDFNIRYAVVDTRKWLPERKVLLPPASFVKVDTEEENLVVEYDKEMIRQSPPVPEDTNLTAEKENQLIQYFGWPGFMPNYTGENGFSRFSNLFRSESDDSTLSKEQTEMEPEKPSRKLQSWMEIMGSRVHATNGKLGRARELVFNKNWKINYVIVESFIGEQKKYYVYSLDDIVSVDWYDGDFYLNETIESFQKKPGYTVKEELLEVLA